MSASESTPTQAGDVVRSEEELGVDVTEHEAGRVRTRKHVEEVPVEREVTREVEQAEMERTAAAEDDAGQVLTFEDGSVSIPVFEEQLVVTKRRVVKERILVRKHTVVEEEVVHADLRRERVEVEADPEVADRVSDTRPEADR